MKISLSNSWKTITIILVAIGLILLALGGYLGPVFASVSRPVVLAQAWLSNRYIAIYQILNSPQQESELRARNIELENEVSQLQSQIITLQQQLSKTQNLEALLGFAGSNPQLQPVAATVIGRDPSPFLHYLIVDQGSDDGIRKGMPVVTQSGLVGKVDAVIAGASRIQLVTDPGSIINVNLQTQDMDAQVIGSITGEITLEMVPQDIVLQSGEMILTSGLGGTFPGDLLIGQVISIRKLENDLYQTATVQPVVDFSQLQAVLIITNFKPVDITPLLPK
ncbi:MAG: rod shape-determining protein MreC [Chloroflexi bacterium HGW-Chloroflexi-8]|jgi:rod shape-determining protein MreC|nr:MAG: rod shape-determining protein MreC [Chloroflexi bacterium HGW-Chloroflexi-8]